LNNTEHFEIPDQLRPTRCSRTICCAHHSVMLPAETLVMWKSEIKHRSNCEKLWTVYSWIHTSI